MIRLIEAKNYRSLKSISQPLDDFHVLVGANASGKTTFLDVVSFLGDLTSRGIEQAIEERTRNFQDLLWMRSGKSFDLAIEFEIPSALRNNGYDVVRYEVVIGEDDETGTVGLFQEKATLFNRCLLSKVNEGKANPDEIAASAKVIINRDVPDQVEVAKASEAIYFFEEDKTGVFYQFSVGPEKSGLANLPEDEGKFPVAVWLKRVFRDKTQPLILNSTAMRKAGERGQSGKLRSDGANLPWLIEDLKVSAPETFYDWIAHVQTALPELEDVSSIERPWERRRYLMIKYKSGVEIPSWMVSDGTLRLLALTLIAYLPREEGVYLIEEPENGVHPLAIETIFKSLSCVYDGQVLIATHSNIIVAEAKASQILCFSRTDEGATKIIRGDQHPDLEDWKGIPNLSVLFASGVLG